MKARYFALILGIVYLLVGILGFIPGITTPPPADAPSLAVNAGYGNIFGIFTVNLVHTLIHLLVGVWGIMAYRSFGAARGFARTIAIVFALLAVMGLLGGALSTTFGLAPLFGADVALHALTALLAGIFGFATRDEDTYVDNTAGPTNTAL